MLDRPRDKKQYTVRKPLLPMLLSESNEFRKGQGKLLVLVCNFLAPAAMCPFRYRYLGMGMNVWFPSQPFCAFKLRRADRQCVGISDPKKKNGFKTS